MPHAEAADPTVTHIVKAAIGNDVFECAMFAEEQNCMADSKLQWQMFHTMADLPDKPIHGWERLVVFTRDYVYDWTANGMGHQLDRLPRRPDALESTT